MKRENIKYAIPKLALFLKTIEIDSNSKILGTHFHKAVELICVHEGEMICCIEDSEHVLSVGDILLINSSVIHQLVCKNRATATYIQININKYSESQVGLSRFLDNFLKSNTAEKFAVFHGENEISGIFGRIKSEFEQKKFCYKDYIRAHIYALVAFMRRNLLLSDTSSLCDASKLAELTPVITHIDENYHTKLSLDDLGSIIRSDRYRLCRLFKAATGATLFEYINFVRLSSAEEMLIKTQKSISEVAFECGFASIQYFNRVFKESRGYTPGAFRKMFAEK